MNLKVEIQKKDLEGFTSGAKDSLKKAVLSYSRELIEESNRIEVDRNSNSRESEVTGAIVDDAVFHMKRGLAKPKKNKIMIACKIASPLASMFSGWLYDPTKFSQGNHIMFFIIAVVISLISTTIIVIKE
ncbi:TPA: hypothetical protein QH442_002278 [Morganella morganii subsp. morganii]|nr:hypothetical protein [Morganella morganii subsp. morganii]